ncbi:MAG: hypothetical protein QOJ29_1258 [Thermoleophilaceae bacterium]|jgi:hypothetical protein|nr:hypothetical protein [Thermoleophilaceae bacterium]
MRFWTLWSPPRRAVARVARVGERIAERNLPDHPQPVLFVVGLPKSGTTWLTQLLEELPRYRRRPFRDPDHCLLNHDVCDALVEYFPRDLYSVFKTHTQPTPENIRVIESHGLPAVVMHRDLRDQCVSRYYHVLQDPTHRHHELYEQLPKDEGMLHSIDATLEIYVPWVEGWVEHLAHSGHPYKELRYEDLRRDPVPVFRDVAAFYGIDLSDAEAATIVEHVKARTQFGKLSAGGIATGKSTARKGSIGDWRNHFGPEHVERFKRGAGELLIRLGYETDDSWAAAPTVAA